MNDITDLRIFLASLLRPIIDDAFRDNIQNLNPASAPAEELPDIIKIAEAETETGFKKGYIYELVSKKAIPYHKVGNSIRFSRSELRSWIRAGRPAILQQAVENMATNYILKK
jgi:excisionase family DNA binding protein